MKKNERNDQVGRLSKALSLAKAAAAAAVRKAGKDEGACNFDAAFLIPTGLAKGVVQEAAEAAGVKARPHNWRGIGGGFFVELDGPCHQGVLRTVAGEAIQRAMQAGGFRCLMYYQLD